MKNIELKARKGNSAAEAQAQALGARFAGVVIQEDRYLRCARGRLKIRRTDGRDPMLVWYERPDEPEARESRYEKFDLSDSLAAVLEAALGVEACVRKTRRLYLWEGVRIHIDDVDGLGQFLEFEAVLPDAGDEREGSRKVAFLREHFGLGAEDMVPESYSDLVRRGPA